MISNAQTLKGNPAGQFQREGVCWKMPETTIPDIVKGEFNGQASATAQRTSFIQETGR